MSSIRQVAIGLGVSISILFSVEVRSCAAQGVRGNDVSAEEVKQSIERGIEFLRSKQSPNGAWSEDQNNEFGITALCTLALLNCGVPATDPLVAQPLKLLENQGRQHITVYVASLRIMVFTLADPTGKRYQRQIAQDATYLIERQVTQNAYEGGWNYGTGAANMFGAIADSSNSQFALLGLHEAARVGFDVPQSVWLNARKYWTNCFIPQRGSFAYSVSGDRPNGAMTCAGISSWLIIDENLVEPAKFFQGNKVKCCGKADADPVLDLALDWLARRFTVTSNPTEAGGRTGSKFYYLYGMERAARMSGQRFIGANDWYREGASHLVSQQSLNGSWTQISDLERTSEITTAFSLLFLAKGKRPIVFGKYRYGDGNNWDLHAPGVHYLTRETEKAWQMTLNWQTVDSNDASVNDLLEAPVMILSGQGALQLNDQQKQNLKGYVENGGFLFVEACQGDGCGDSVPFDASFRALMKELFPDSELEALAADHPIWSSNYRLIPDPDWPVLGLQACCRTSVVYCTRNLSCYWQLDRPQLLNRLALKTKDDVIFCRQLGINVAAYATNRELEEKLSRPKMKDNDLEMLKERVLIFPKLQHSGGADDAPNAWRTLQQDLQAKAHLNINVEKKMIDPTLEQLADYPFVFMHGRSKFSFDAEQRTAIKTYIEREGLIFADSICSSKEFTESFRRECKSIFPDNPLTPIPPNHPIWNDDKYGYKIDTVQLHTPDREAAGGFSIQKTAPLLEGIEIEGRLAVIFSPYDISCALEKAAATQCKGYSRDDAIRIGSNVILYRLRVD